ncbi:helix-turn-helix domain-containing protein [Saccharothrix sp. NRRL B-16348]|uniref:helix-turn-helix domain-containing protein n=1 Tax=Saccharothrix sp. NRRL B-16348 TaxID=1415542 RepID=UPI001E36A976|nr:helix-turn-helix domain-containing protein [Saccharothrix sp. NRRL B-16348]
MLTPMSLAASADFTVDAVTCTDSHPRWSEAEAAPGHLIVLVRRGRFRRRARDGVFEAEPGTAYVQEPGEPVEFAHPAGGDVCTAVWVRPGLWRSVVGEDRPARTSFYVDAAVDLAHRRLVGRRDVEFGVAEGLVGLLGAAVGRLSPRPLPGAEDRAAVAAAREAVLADAPESAGLVPLAESLGVSPYRLSRAFSREVGVSLTRFRNRVRVGRAVERLEAGEHDLAGLAADLGFADQAHLTRTVREHLGHTPAALRRLLAG